MNTFIIIIILAIVQGLTEFLPISSSGHLNLLYEFFGIEESTLFVTITLHLSTLLAVVIYYRKTIYELIRHPICPTNRKILVASICTILTALPIYPIIDIFSSREYLIFTFTITAIILLISDYLSNTRYNLSNIYSIYSTNTNISISYKQAIMIGLSQGIAIIPGISRSGTTIATALITSVDRDNATKFSFLISIPIILGSGALEIIDICVNKSTLSFGIFEIIIASVICFVVGYLAIRVCTTIVSKNKLYIFSYYLIILVVILTILGFVL